MIYINHAYTDQPVCPYCGKQQLEEIQCPTYLCKECGKYFSVSTNIKVLYTTSKLCVENGIEYNYEFTTRWMADNTEYLIYKCSNCDNVDVR